jgi:hypothetical protein
MRYLQPWQDYLDGVLKPREAYFGLLDEVSYDLMAMRNALDHGDVEYVKNKLEVRIKALGLVQHMDEKNLI